jgi:hypothetical protein
MRQIQRDQREAAQLEQPGAGTRRRARVRRSHPEHALERDARRLRRRRIERVGGVDPRGALAALRGMGQQRERDPGASRRVRAGDHTGSGGSAAGERVEHRQAGGGRSGSHPGARLRGCRAGLVPDRAATPGRACRGVGDTSDSLRFVSGSSKKKIGRAGGGRAPHGYAGLI